MSAARLDALRRLEALYLAEAERGANRMRRYLYDPVGWVNEFMDIRSGGLTHYQERILGALAQHRRVAVRGPHGLGKSFSASMAILWFAMTREALGIDWKVVVTASAWRQISGFLFPEVRRWARALRWDEIGREPFNERYELLHLGLNLRHGAVITAAASDPAKLEGAHADSLLVCFDEAKAILPATWDAIEGAFSGGKLEGFPEAFALALSTPGETSGRFYEIHSRRPGLEDWHPVHITLQDAIQAGRISEAWAQQRKAQWGENSALYQRRVEGNFHADDSGAVIPLTWVEAAIERWHEWNQAGRPDPGGVEYTSVDVARGGDESVIGRRKGHVLMSIATDHGRDTMKLVAAVAALPGRPVVDVIGVGAGVFDRLREMKLKPIAHNGSAQTTLRDRSKEFRLFNARSAAYWHLRELLDPEFEPTICLPPDELMISDLTIPTWDVTSGVPAKIQVEKKEDVVARLGRSPDRGDMVAMAFYADATRSPMSVAMPQGSIQRTGLSPLGRK